MKLKCPNCGNVFELVEGKTECFCSNCGTKLKAPKPKEKVEVQEEQLLEEQKEEVEMVSTEKEEAEKENVIGLIGFFLSIASLIYNNHNFNFTNSLLKLFYKINVYISYQSLYISNRFGCLLIGLAIAIVSVVFSKKALKIYNRFRGFAVAGLAIGIVGIVWQSSLFIIDMFNLS